jgi:signal transduction histidine kinase
MMLHDLLTANHHEIVAATRARMRLRPSPVMTGDELPDGIPLCLRKLVEILRLESSATPFSAEATDDSASVHGGARVALGGNLSQVVHDYGDLCQAVMQVAVQHGAAITIAEFQVLDRCLVTAIDEAVTEHARLSAAARTSEECARADHAAATWTSAEMQRAGGVVHEVRDMLNTALFAFEALKRGAVAINGSTSAVLGRSLLNLRDFVNSMLADISVQASHQQRRRLSADSFVHDVAAAAALQAEYRHLQLTVTPVDPLLMLEVDPQLVSSAVTNLLNNAFKFTKAGGRVTLRAHSVDERILIEIEDECGGIPDSIGDPFSPFAEKRGADRSGLGLGLSIARKAIRAHDGDISIRNRPGVGCVFVVDLPPAIDSALA